MKLGGAVIEEVQQRVRDVIESDEALVARFQTGQDEFGFALRDLYERYKPLLRTTLYALRAKYSRISGEDWSSYVHEYFWEAVRKYDPNSGAMFRTFLDFKLKKRCLDVIRDRFYNKHQKLGGRWIPKAESKFVEVPYEPGMIDPVVTGPDAHELLGMMESYDHVPLFRHLRERSIEDATFLTLREAGYSYNQIADMAGRKGTQSANRVWGNSVMVRIRRVIANFLDMERHSLTVGSHGSDKYR